ncbi:MAG: hypothetical protein P1U87_15260 [Verrucomicrobiales bacterium]|nr:hypothetical protein [Verrucomicrobiales bacterium]
MKNLNPILLLTLALAAVLQPSSGQAQVTPLFSEPFTCPQNQIFHTIDHDDLTSGSFPGGITVTTAISDIAGTTTISTPGITLAGAGSGFVATTPFIEGGGALRFVNTDNEAVQVVYNFSEALTNPFLFIQSDGPEQGTTFQLFEGDGVTPIGITKIDGDSEMVVTGGSLVENTDVSAAAQNHTAYFQVQDNTARATIILRIFNNTPHGLDGYNVGIGACVADPTASFPPIDCPPGVKLHTVEHLDLTQGTLPGGINVSTVVTPTGTPTVSTISATGLAGAFVNTTNFIESGGGLRFVTTDGEAVDVAFTFSKAVKNPFVFIGTDGPEPDTLTELFEIDGTTPIPFVKIDGEDEFGVNNGRTIVNTDTTSTNRQGYVQVQDGILRKRFILRVSNTEVFGLDGYNVGIGVCPQMECLDLSTRTKDGRKKGVGIINNSAAGQTIRLVSRKCRSVTASVILHNDCGADDEVRFTGRRPSFFWDINYTIDGRNVTGAIKRGAYQFPIGMDEKVTAKVRVKPIKQLWRRYNQTSRRVQLDVKVKGTLVSDPTIKDANKLRVLLR